MLQIVSISQARSNLSKLIRKVKETKLPIVIVQNSSPSAVLYPYEEVLRNDEKKEKIFQDEFNKILTEADKLWASYKIKNKIKKNLTEQEAYALIKQS